MFRFYIHQYWLRIEILSPIPHNPSTTEINWVNRKSQKPEKIVKTEKILWDAVIDDGGVDSS